MKTRFLLILLGVSIGYLLKAQDYKVVSVESLPLDMTAREHIKQDERGRQCAVFRIVTQNIAPELREGFHFECDWNSFVVAHTLQEGEILVWVSPGIKTLKIKHEKLGPWDLHLTQYLPKVESLFTYRIALQGTMTLDADKEPEVAQQYLTFQVSPTDAELEVDGEIWPLSARGTARRRVKEGDYHYRITAFNCEDEESTVSVVDTAVVVTVTLKPISKKPKTKEPKAEVKQPETEQPTPQKAVGGVFFVMANAAYSIAPQTSFGLTVGSAKKLGWYVSLGSNFQFKNADYVCDGSGTISGASFEYSYWGDKSTSRLNATAGVIARISDPVYAYIGGGYGFRNVYWSYYEPLEGGNWAKCTDDSYQGIALDAGVMLHFNGFGLSLGVQTIGFNYMEAKIGIGYTLKRR